MDGINKDEGKLRLDLVSPEAIEAIARVAGQACESGKYPERNWEQGMDWMRQYASCMRHLMKWMKGEDLDDDTGLPHLEHAMWRLAALVTYAKRRIGNDDRPGYPEEPENLAHYDAVIGHNDDVCSKPRALTAAERQRVDDYFGVPLFHRDLSDDEIEQQDEGRTDPADLHNAKRTKPTGYDIQQNPDPLPTPMCNFGVPGCPVCE